MKKTLLFVLALIAVGCADPIPRDLDDLSRQGPQYLNPETLEPYSGPAYRTSEDDPTEIVLRVNLRDGRLHGDYQDFELEGVADSLGLYQTGTYRDGQLEGPFEVCYPSSVLRGRGTYENGLQEGPYESYHENGEPRSKVNFTAGEVDGPYENYHENGQLREKGTYVAGERDGPFETYFARPIRLVRWKGTYNMGEQCGEWFEFGTKTVTYDPCPPGLEDGN